MGTSHNPYERYVNPHWLQFEPCYPGASHYKGHVIIIPIYFTCLGRENRWVNLSGLPGSAVAALASES